MNSAWINNLRDPSSAQDAATRNYVDASINIVTAAITTALGINGTMLNSPSVYRNDNLVGFVYLAGAAVGGYANYSPPINDGVNGRCNLYMDTNLFYSPSTNTLYASTFSGNATSATTAVSAGGLTTAGSQYTYIDFYTNGLERMRIIQSGYVGIGTQTPNATLHVSGSGSNTITGTGRYWDLNANTGTASGSTWAISIITENSIWNKGQHNWLTSDQRIKTNIVNLNADKMMNIFRNVRPISFDYIDPTKNNNKKHFGFIAQEVKEVLPEGITLNTDVIPNNMMKGEIDQKSKIEASFTLKPDDTDISLNYLLLKTDTSVKFDTANTYSSTNVYKFKVSCGEKWSKEQDIYICSEYNVIDDKYTYVIGMKKDVYDIVITEPTLFVYGQYVYDLHILDHDTIYTVATAALQEVDRQQQADKIRIAELEATVAKQQSLINDILEILKTLEKA